MDALMSKILFGVNRVGTGSHGCWQNLLQGVPSFMKLSGGCDAKQVGFPLGVSSCFPESHYCCLRLYLCAAFK